MARPRTSPIHQYSKEEFISLCEGKYLQEIINEVWNTDSSCRGSTTYYKTVRAKMEEFGMDPNDYRAEPGIKLKGIRRHSQMRKVPLEELYESRRILNHAQKLRIKDDLGLKCQCGLTDTWNGNPIVLQLDHINGDCLDNRKENLRVLCPNCHSQTNTFGNKKRAS